MVSNFEMREAASEEENKLVYFMEISPAKVLLDLPGKLLLMETYIDEDGGFPPSLWVAYPPTSPVP